ncbi:hypothetical protein [Paenibacillus sp. IITD108]|uniref:hypothetical protein n=1 Tax=Paenibacillus sp. IITD108 TaxID=3116649 RepID=UPI002F3E2A3F
MIGLTRKMKPNTPRQKRMNRQGRVQSARTWINSYTGKNIVRGYSKRYGVDLLCAVKELEILGVKTEKKYIEQLKNQQKAHIKMKEKRKRKEDLDYDLPFEQDNRYYFIAGYTPNGFACGITWEEYEKIKEEEY